jgi:hypothetical protein
MNRNDIWIQPNAEIHVSSIQLFTGQLYLNGLKGSLSFYVAVVLSSILILHHNKVIINAKQKTTDE